jgi:hypothetical protein
MIIKVKEKQKYIKVYDLNMKLIESFYSAREASRYIGAVHSTIFSAMNKSYALYNKYYIKTEGLSHIEYTKEIDAPVVKGLYTECRKCGITLCEKNQFLTETGKAKEKGVKHKFGDCRQCVKKTNHCNIKYDDPVLNELCKKQAVVLYNKLYPKKHRETINRNNRNTKNKNRSLLTDSIVINDLIHSTKIQKILGRRIEKSEITPIMIDVKRKHTLLTRTLKQIEK